MESIKYPVNNLFNLKVIIKNQLRTLDSKRKKKTQSLETWFLKQLSSKKHMEKTLIPASEVKNVLIVRNNIRIGNMFFLLPFINEIENTYPNAKIDLLITEEWQGEIFKNTNINKIHYSKFRFKSFFTFLQKIKTLRQTKYDVSIVPYSSSSDLIISSLLKTRNLVSAKSKRNDIFCSHTFENRKKHKHYALSPLSLLNEISQNEDMNFNPYMNFSQLELLKGEIEFNKLTEQSPKTHNVAFFRGARGEKVISDIKWIEMITLIYKYYNRDVNIIEIMSSDIKEPLGVANFLYENKNLRALASTLKNFDYFICADTGPLHLASSANVNCIGLFTTTNPDKYGTLGESTINIKNMETYDIEKIITKLENKILEKKVD